MDQETFETLVEVLAFECAHDPKKSKVFADMFYGKYSNKGPSFLNLDAALSYGREATVISHGRPMPAYITKCEWVMEGNQRGRDGLIIRLELSASGL